jgi:hypothetical protein
MKTRCLSTLGITTLAALFLAQAVVFGLPPPVTVYTVPWTPILGASPTTPHTTYAINPTTEAMIVLGATVPSAVGSTDAFTYQWNFGDGTSSAVSAVTNPYDISAKHQYPASAGTGTQWTAVVTVTDTTTGGTGSAKYYAIQESNVVTITPSCPYSCAAAAVVGARANVAIDWGLWYMHQTMWRGTTTVNSNTVNWGGWDQQTTNCPTVNGDAWDCDYYGVIDAENVQAFEVNNHMQNGPVTDPYTDDVARGLARMFNFLATQTAASNTYTYNPATANYTCNDGSVPSTGDPLCTTHGGQYFYNPGATSCTAPNCVFTFDANKNNIQTYSNDGSGEYSYTTSPFMEAMIAAGTPLATAPTGVTNIQGQTFQTLVQDMADFYNYSQWGQDSDVSQGSTRGASQSQGGAWLYGPQQGDDNSTSQWAAIGLISGYRAFSIPIPPIVTDTNNVWITNSQDVGQPAPTGPDSFTPGSTDNLGSFGYRGSWQYSQEWGPFAMTPSGMVQMALDGVGRTTNTVFGNPTTAFDQRWNNSETFYADNFCNDPYAYGTTGGYTDAYYAPKAYMYGLFSFTKSMLLHDPSFGLSPITYLRTQTPNVFTTNTSSSIPANTIDWYAGLSSANGGMDPCDGVAQTLVTFQTSPVAGVFDGHWYGNTADVGYDLQSPFETAWALIMLRGTGFISCATLAGQGVSAGAAPARIDLSWSNQQNSTSYDIFRSTTNGGPYTMIGKTTVTAYSDTKGLTNGDTYYYVVQPINGTTEVCQSNQATITIPALSGRR